MRARAGPATRRADIAADGHEGSIDDVPIITGVQDGDRYSYELDLREFFGQFADALDERRLPILDDYIEQLSTDERFGRNADPDALAALAERMLDTEMPVEVWVDGEGYVRRISQEVDLLELLGWGYLLATENPLDEYTLGATTDFADYGDETIAVELPSDSVDATDIFRRALDAGPPDD